MANQKAKIINHETKELSSETYTVIGTEVEDGEIKRYKILAGYEVAWYDATSVHIIEEDEKETYSAQDIITMLENNQITFSDYVVNKNNVTYQLYELKLNMFINDAPYTFPETYTFEEARLLANKNGCRFKHMKKNKFQSIYNVLQDFAGNSSETINSMMSEKAWIIEVESLKTKKTAVAKMPGKMDVPY